MSLKRKSDSDKEEKVAKKRKAKFETKTTVTKSDVGESEVRLRDLLRDKKWRKVLSQEFEQPYFKELESNLESEYKSGKTIFPPQDLIFNAFNLTPLDKVKVVIIGQNPYHNIGQAMGLSFSVPQDIKTPPSLKNIYKELERDPDIEPRFQIPDHGCLDKWAQNGVLLLNASLTVESGKSNSHGIRKFGWQTFTDNVIKTISDHGKPAVFILLGKFAQKKGQMVDEMRHRVLRAAHPSPLSVSKFRGCNCFSMCNAMLRELGHTPMNWSL